MKIFDLLNSYTSDTGSWSIEYNDHKLVYKEPAQHYLSDDDGNELDSINTKQDIYRLYWFNDTPVGHYCILANSIEELEEKIIDVIREERLTKYKTEEIKPKTDLNISCKYKIQIENKFDDKPYCTCFCELCEDLPICDKNCQIFEDYKMLMQKNKEVLAFKKTANHLFRTNEVYYFQISLYRYVINKIENFIKAYFKDISKHNYYIGEISKTLNEITIPNKKNEVKNDK